MLKEPRSVCLFGCLFSCSKASMLDKVIRNSLSPVFCYFLACIFNSCESCVSCAFLLWWRVKICRSKCNAILTLQYWRTWSGNGSHHLFSCAVAKNLVIWPQVTAGVGWTRRCVPRDIWELRLCYYERRWKPVNTCLHNYQSLTV